MKKLIMKFSGELSVDERLESLMSANLKTAEQKKNFLEGVLNQAIDEHYKIDTFDLKIEVEE